MKNTELEGVISGIVMGSAIRGRRRKLNMVQAELGSRVSLAMNRTMAYSQPNISAWEHGRPVPLKIADALAGILEIDISTIRETGSTLHAEKKTIKTGEDLRKSEYGKVLAIIKAKQTPFVAEFEIQSGGLVITSGSLGEARVDREFSFNTQGILDAIKVEKHLGTLTQELELKRQPDGKFAITRQAARLNRPEEHKITTKAVGESSQTSPERNTVSETSSRSFNHLFQNEFGTSFRDWLFDNKLRQRGLAKRLGVNEQTISRWAREDIFPQQRQWDKICELVKSLEMGTGEA